MTPQPRVQIFILTRNRLLYLIPALESVLAQSYSPLEIFISDNSTNAETEHFLSQHPQKNRFHYLRRNPPLALMEHHTTLVREASSEYVMFFHDDDILKPQAIEKMVAALDANPYLSAAAMNADVIDGASKTLGSFNAQLKQDVQIQTASEFVRQYMKRPMNIVPFSSYLYRRKLIEDLSFSNKAGRKHADVSFLISAVRKGPFQWISQPLMQYRVHGDNGSSTFDIKALLSLCKVIENNCDLPKSEIDQFKMQSLLAWYLYLIRSRLWRKNRFFAKVFLKVAIGYFLVKPHKLAQIALRKT